MIACKVDSTLGPQSIHTTHAYLDFWFLQHERAIEYKRGSCSSRTLLSPLAKCSKTDMVSCGSHCRLLLAAPHATAPHNLNEVSDLQPCLDKIWSGCCCQQGSRRPQEERAERGEGEGERQVEVTVPPIRVPAYSLQPFTCRPDTRLLTGSHLGLHAIIFPTAC